MVIVGTIGIQKDKAEVHNLNSSTLAVVRAFDESSDTDEDCSEELVETILRRTGGVEPAVRHGRAETACSDCQGGVDPAGPSALVGRRTVGHRLTHKPTDPERESCIRGKMKNLRTYAGALSKPLKHFGGVITMDHCSVYDAGMQYALSGNTVALVVRDVCSTFGAVYPAPS